MVLSVVCVLCYIQMLIKIGYSIRAGTSLTHMITGAGLGFLEGGGANSRY